MTLHSHDSLQAIPTPSRFTALTQISFGQRCMHPRETCRKATTMMHIHTGTTGRLTQHIYSWAGDHGVSMNPTP